MYTNLIVLLFLIFFSTTVKNVKTSQFDVRAWLNMDEWSAGTGQVFLSVKKVVQTLHVWFETKLHNLV